MTPSEEPFFFDCQGERLVGIVTQAEGDSELGVVVVVGGPQYRIGSHRQFVLLARALAAAGFPAMRFDCRGMGDATGATRDFESIGADIASAASAFVERVPRLRRLVLWGLCDAASAALFYARGDPRVAGLVLLNPWVRTEAGLARTRLRHYYLGRVFDRSAWRRLLRSDADRRAAVTSFVHSVRRAADSRAPREALTPAARDHASLPVRLADALTWFGKDVLVVLSGDDFTAKEFRAMVDGDVRWRRALACNRVDWHELPDANHTFARRVWRDDVAAATVTWLRRVARRSG